MVLLAAEILTLFLLSRFLSRSLSRIFYTLTGSRKVTVYLLATIFLPGTIVHELAHLLSAGMLMVPMGNIEIFPEIDGDHVRLGSAEVGETDMIRRMVIGVAPVIVGLGLIFVLLWIFQESLLLLYFIFAIANNMFSSKKDLEGALAFFGAIIVVFSLAFGALYLTDNLLWLSLITLPDLSGFLERVNKFLLVPIIIDLVLIIAAYLFTGLLKAAGARRVQ